MQIHTHTKKKLNVPLKHMCDIMAEHSLEPWWTQIVFCSWLLFEMQHCVSDRLSWQGDFIKIQLTVSVSGKLLLSLVCALQYPRSDGYCDGIIWLKRSWRTNEDAFRLVHFSRAALWKPTLTHGVINRCYYKVLSPSQLHQGVTYQVHSDLIASSCMNGNKFTLAAETCPNILKCKVQ